MQHRQKHTTEKLHHSSSLTISMVVTRVTKSKASKTYKKHLEIFGYLNSYFDNDDFDDILESAIKTYQVNYHLKATGTLDAKTVSRMTMPRCGVPDIINGTTSMRPGNKSTPAEAQAAVARAFATWAGNTHFSFSQAQSYENADLKISFGRGDHGDGAPFDGRGGTLAHAFPPNQWEIPLQPWAVGAVEGAYDLETVALHEIGHLLGLGHSSVEGAVMSSGVRTGFTQSLHADDIQGIKALCNT
ncbi:hypothetical protein PS1_023905 [Malus domestica]